MAEKTEFLVSCEQPHEIPMYSKNTFFQARKTFFGWRIFRKSSITGLKPLIFKRKQVKVQKSLMLCPLIFCVPCFSCKVSARSPNQTSARTLGQNMAWQSDLTWRRRSRVVVGLGFFHISQRTNLLMLEKSG